MVGDLSELKNMLLLCGAATTENKHSRGFLRAEQYDREKGETGLKAETFTKCFSVTRHRQRFHFNCI